MSALADTAIVLVAAGASVRMGFDKVWADLEGRPLLAHALEAAAAAQPCELVLVVAESRLDDARRLVGGLTAAPPDVRVVHGGARRRDSAAAGLAACAAPWVAIHDAARALAPARLFAAGRVAAEASGAAVPTLPVKDTLKRVANGHVFATLPRAEIHVVQTPQVFRRDVLSRALAATDDDATDEASLVERLGVSVAIFAGDERGFKVTTPLDFDLARLALHAA